MDFLNYDIDPMLKKKIIMDFLWFAELYVEDIKKRTTVAMERLKHEGRLYHRPTILHYVALYLSKKYSFKELTKEDIQRAREYIKKTFERYAELRVPWYRIHKLFIETFADLYRRYPNAPRSYQAVVKALKQILSK